MDLKQTPPHIKELDIFESGLIGLGSVKYTTANKE